MAESTTRPGERTVPCPKCGSQKVTITGNNLGSDLRWGRPFTRLECGACGHGQYFAH